MRISDWSSDVCSSDLQSERAIARKENPAKQSNVKNRVGESIQSDMRGAERCFAPAGQPVASECGNDPGTDQRDQRDHRREGKSPAHTSWHRVTRSVEIRSEEHTSELQSLMRNSYAVFCLKKKTKQNTQNSISTDILKP